MNSRISTLFCPSFAFMIGTIKLHKLHVFIIEFREKSLVFRSEKPMLANLNHIINVLPRDAWVKKCQLRVSMKLTIRLGASPVSKEETTLFRIQRE